MTALTRTELATAFAWATSMALPNWANGLSGSGLSGSPHDFSRPESSDSGLCIFCHVGPSGAGAADNGGWAEGAGTLGGSWASAEKASALRAADPYDSLPLWNASATGVETRYSMYANGPGAPTLKAKASQAIANGMYPGTTSLVCLGCHDGSVAINTYGNASGLTRLSAVGRDRYLGNHHPVGFDYDAVRAVDREIRSADATNLTATSTVRDHLYGPNSARMECGTCHSVHNTGNSNRSLLWCNDSRSRLCLACHDKGIYVPC